MNAASCSWCVPRRCSWSFVLVNSATFSTTSAMFNGILGVATEHAPVGSSGSYPSHSTKSARRLPRHEEAHCPATFEQLGWPKARVPAYQGCEAGIHREERLSHGNDFGTASLLQSCNDSNEKARLFVNRSSAPRLHNWHGLRDVVQLLFHNRRPLVVLQWAVKQVLDTGCCVASWIQLHDTNNPVCHGGVLSNGTK